MLCYTNIIINKRSIFTNFIKINMNYKEDRKPSPEICKVYPHFTDEQLIKAEDNLDRYLELMLQIFERLERESRENDSQNCKEGKTDI